MYFQHITTINRIICCNMFNINQIKVHCHEPSHIATYQVTATFRKCITMFRFLDGYGLLLCNKIHWII